MTSDSSTTSADTSLQGKRALICGASAGIGRSVAAAMAAKGAHVTGVARRQEALESLQQEIGADRCGFLVADLEQTDQLERAVRANIEQHGPFHILLNNTGGPPGGPILEADISAFEVGFRRHVLAGHTLLRTLLPGMRGANYGRIINVISTSVREPIPNLGVSNTIRGAMASWAKSVSKELPPGVTINNILPGYTDTDRLGSLRDATAKRLGKTAKEVLEMWLGIIPEGRLGHPDEIAATIAFLASPAAAYIRGQSIAVDGGRMASI